MDDDRQARRTEWLVIFAITSLLGLLAVGQTLVIRTTEGESGLVPQLIAYSLVSWWYWAAVAPIVFRAAERFPVTGRHWPRAILPHLAVALVLVLVHIGLITWLGKAMLEAPPNVRPWRAWLLGYLTNRLHFELIAYAALVIAHVALREARRARERDLAAVELAGALARSELQALKMQLHPHFLFNALNAIAVLTDESPSDARRAILVLADLLRATLASGTAQEIPLGQELDLLRRYLEIERLRFSDRLHVDVDVPDALLTARVPAFILQPLVENAVRHGIAPRAAPGAIAVRATNGANELTLEVWNDGTLPADAATAGGGIGLATTRARLARLYGERASLALAEAAGGVSATVRLPLTDSRD